ncbi:MAG: hypothetical protein P1V97_10240, partial [Planctomycetota bacterium]|nr:hypothetical protein [Planctomycetota bacterium]
ASKACALTLKGLGRAAINYAKKNESFPWFENDRQGRRALGHLIEGKYFGLKDVVFSLGEELNSVQGFPYRIDKSEKEPQPILWHTTPHSTGERHIVYSDGTVKSVDDDKFQEILIQIKVQKKYRSIDQRPYCKSCKRRCPLDANFCPEHGTALIRVDIEAEFRRDFKATHELRIEALLKSLVRDQWRAWEKLDSKRFLSLKELAEARNDKALVKGTKYGYTFVCQVSKSHPKTIFWLTASPNKEKGNPYFFVGPNGRVKRLTAAPRVNPDKGSLIKEKQ